MSIQLTGGSAKGFSLIPSPYETTRSTLALLRKRPFDSMLNNLEDYEFYDLCAGVGTMGLEALSRGAKHVYFIEPDLKAMAILKKNIANFERKYPHLSNKSIKTTTYKSTAQDFLQKLNAESIHENCIFFLDPPYQAKNIYENCITLLQSKASHASIWVEGTNSPNQGKFKKLYSHSDNWIGILE